MTEEFPEQSIAEALSRLRSRGGRVFGADHDLDEAEATGGGDPRRRAQRYGAGIDTQRGRGRRGGGGPALRRLVSRLSTAARPLSISDLSNEIGVDQPRASRLVAQGVEMGVLRREADPEDARRVQIVLTDDGQKLATHLREAHRKTVELALEGFSGEERQQLATLLSRLADAWPRSGAQSDLQ
jgi:DNA-binding MarR family transcriptional regulator